MEIKVKIDGKERTLKARKLFGEETKKGFKLYMKIANKNQEDLTSLDTYLDYLDKLVLDVFSITEKELGRMFDEDQSKLISYLQEKIQKKIDFLRSSEK